MGHVQEEAVELKAMEATPEKATMLPPGGPQGERLTREQRRSRRKRTVRARTIDVRTMKRSSDVSDLMAREIEQHDRPSSRSECVEGPRPCPYISCRHHLYLDVSPRTGSIKINFPDLEVWELAQSCALDIADEGGITLEDLGELLNVTRERVRQLEIEALDKLESVSDMYDLREFAGERALTAR